MPFSIPVNGLWSSFLRFLKSLFYAALGQLECEIFIFLDIGCNNSGIPPLTRQNIMKINQSIQIVEELLAGTQKRAEIKLLGALQELLQSLKDHPLSSEEQRSIEKALDDILFPSGTQAGFKELKRNRNKFMSYLRNEFSLTPKGYYMSLGIGLGLAFGAAFGSLIQSITGNTLPVGVGVSIGMVIGMSIGIMKDNEAERQNRVLQTKSMV